MNRTKIFLGLVLALAWLFTACGMPSELLKKAEEAPKNISDKKAKVDELEKAYQKYSSTADFKAFKRYAVRENWSEDFPAAKAELARAEKNYNDVVVPLVKENKSDSQSKVEAELKRIATNMDNAVKQAQRPSNRFELLKKTAQEAPAMTAKAEQETKEINAIVIGLFPLVEKAKTDYPDRDKDILGRYAPFTKIDTDGQKMLGTIKLQMAALTAESTNENAGPDYAVLLEQCTLITNNLTKMKADKPKFEAKINELYQSYTKRLADMRADYFVTIGRVSWDEDADWTTEHTYDYKPVQVDEATYEFYDKLNDEITIAEIGFLTNPIHIDQNQWNKLHVNMTEEKSSWDDRAEFYIADQPVKFFHKYELETNGVVTTTDWKEVDEKYFDNNDENLGMDLESKPYGAFEEEKEKAPAPPGMAYVGNPKYGTWTRDPATGSNFWSFYGQYMFLNTLLGGNNYRHDTWGSWRSEYRGRKPYYGKDDDEYGSSGTRTASHYSGSHYAKTGGFRNSEPSVRGAGPHTRGGGPGGGGK